MLFLTFTTGNYTKMTENLIINFKTVLAPHGHKLYIVCLDSRATDNLASYSECEFIVLDSRDINPYTEIGSFASPSFNTINSYKPVLIREFLDKYDEFYFVDCDLVFYQDPAPFTVGYDMLFQQDHETDEYRICTGNFYIRNTPEVVKFIDNYKNTVCSSDANIDNNNEQMILNRIICEKYGTITNIPGMSAGVFPPAKFQRGCDAIEAGWWRKDGVVVVHVNYRSGFESKKAALQSIGQWKV